jgi:C4-dicarboxylate-specific signal transduction histidine kinase
MSDIISSMRSLYRESDSDELEVYTLGDVIGDISRITADRCHHKQIEFAVVIDEQLLLEEVKCCKGQVGQVLLSLLNNSIDAIEQQGGAKAGKISLSAFVKEDQYIFQVSDSAGGIQSDVADKIFQPFFTTKEVGSGPGLGLSLSAKIIKDHAGKLEIFQSDKNKTIFQFNLPAKHTA